MTWYYFDWLATPSGKYSPALIREFYASYVMTIIGETLKKGKPLAQPYFTKMIMHGVPVNISETTISRFLFGPKY